MLTKKAPQKKFEFHNEELKYKHVEASETRGTTALVY
jgi:hypothetical protein